MSFSSTAQLHPPATYDLELQPTGSPSTTLPRPSLWFRAKAACASAKAAFTNAIIAIFTNLKVLKILAAIIGITLLGLCLTLVIRSLGNNDDARHHITYNSTAVLASRSLSTVTDLQTEYHARSTLHMKSIEENTAGLLADLKGLIAINVPTFKNQPATLQEMVSLLHALSSNISVSENPPVSLAQLQTTLAKVALRDKELASFKTFLKDLHKRIEQVLGHQDIPHNEMEVLLETEEEGEARTAFNAWLLVVLCIVFCVVYCALDAWLE